MNTGRPPFMMKSQIKLLGVRDSNTFPTRRDAVEWSARRETEIREAARKPPGQLHTLREALQRYSKENAPKKRGEHWEQVRLAAFENYLLPLDTAIGSVNPRDIALFRDERAKVIKPASVRRELTILSAVFETARRDWGWIEHNPCRDISKPKLPRHRERVIHWWEIRLMLRAMNYVKGRPVTTKTQALAVCWLVALRTGMRSGELCALTWDRVAEKFCHLPITKNDLPRDVPLSRRARILIEQMRGWSDTTVFGLNPASRDTLFRKYRDRCGLEGFTFHDSRHTAATMLSRKLGVLDLCKMFGWTDTKQALTYYNPHASTIASLLE